MAYQGAICDLDVHHMPNSDAELVEYLPQQWRDYVHIDDENTMPVSPPVHSHGPLHETGVSIDAYGDDGVKPAASYERLCEQLLDRCNYYRAMLDFRYSGIPSLPWCSVSQSRRA